jgi:hypothetical protein
MKITSRVLPFLTVVIAMLFITACASSTSSIQDEAPEITEDGLHRVHGSNLTLVYADPEASLADYQRVKLLDATVAFKKNWLRDQQSTSVSKLRITSSDVEDIKEALSKEFHKVFSETLQEGGYEVTDETGDDVLLVKPAIVNLDINAPDTQSAGRSRTYTDNAGEMTLYIELHDSVTGDLLAKAMDRRADRSTGGYYTWTNSVTNKAAADRIIKGWANILVNALDDARK